jgi:hypothetical protein
MLPNSCRYAALVTVFLLACGQGDATNGPGLLQQAIRYHDPNGEWASFANTLTLEERRPSGEVNETFVTLDNTRGSFQYRRDDGENLVVKGVAAGECFASLNGSDTFDAQQAEAHRLSCDLVERSRNYYLFLWGLPMKLLDPGTIVADSVVGEEFEGQDVLSVRVTYDEQVGSDIWYFYLDPQSHRMVGYRFYHDEAANDGEYIVLQDEYELGGLRIPQSRSWYRNDDGTYLGTDVLRSHGPAESLSR